MKILLVDDHTLFRDGLKLLLQRLDEGIEILEAASCQQGLDLADANADLHLVLLDLNLPDRTGFEGLAELRERHAAIPVVVLSASDDRATVMETLDRGAMGFIPKSSSTDVLLSALRLVLAKGVYIPPSVLSQNTNARSPSQGSVPLPAPFASGRPIKKPGDLGLTERQSDVLALLVQGKPNKIICRELGLAEATVKAHVTAVLKALNVTNRTQAVIAVGRLGLTFAKAETFGMTRER
jgi:DNA-binding NarL/FixJ family response regulator